MILRFFFDIPFVEGLDDVIHAHNPYQALADHDGKPGNLLFAHDVLDLSECGLLGGGNQVCGHDILHLQSVNQFKDDIR